MTFVFTGVVAGLMLMSAMTVAAPFTPTQDSAVLEQLPQTFFGDLDQLREAAAAAPQDARKAAALANAYYQLSRRESDPRYLGYAQAALLPWWTAADAPTPVLLARATILQSSHQFGRALADLDTVIGREPDNASAILVRATVKTVIGKYVDARNDCDRLANLVQHNYFLTCVAGILSTTGKATEARTALEQASGATADMRGLIASLLAEITARQGDGAAERHFRTALKEVPHDDYSLGAYCDWLLEQGRPAEVVSLVENQKRKDGMLLRLALAEKALGLKTAQASIAELAARFAASRARGDTVHRREESRFQLALNNDVQAALKLATENWDVQKEPADLLILAEAARASGDAVARDVVRSWLVDTKIEYPAVAELVK